MAEKLRYLFGERSTCKQGEERMRNQQLKSVTVYFGAEGFEQVSEEASDHGVSVSAYIRARLGFAVRERGAPAGKRHQRRSSEAGVASSGVKHK